MDLPNHAERKQIFSLRLSKRKRTPADFNLDQIAAAARGFSGAEIESVVQTALYAAYSQKQQLASDHLLQVRSTVPLSTTRTEEIEALRDWAEKRAFPATALQALSPRAT